MNKKEDKKLAVYYKKRVFEYVNRNLPDYFTSMTIYDRELITWILERTVSYGKMEERISFKNFTEGVLTQKDDVFYTIQSRVLMCRTQLIKTIKSLQSIGILNIKKDSRKVKDKNVYSINLKHPYFKGLDDFIANNNCMLKTPKGALSIRQGCGSSDEYDSAHNEHDNVHNEYYNNHNKITITNNNQTKENRSQVNSSQASRVIPKASTIKEDIEEIDISIEKSKKKILLEKSILE